MLLPEASRQVSSFTMNRLSANQAKSWIFSCRYSSFLIFTADGGNILEAGKTLPSADFSFPACQSKDALALSHSFSPAFCNSPVAATT